jgi:superfamily II DNA or RNA helicase
MLSAFFTFWRASRIKMLNDGFTVQKSDKTGKWYLYETKDNAALFRIFKDKPLTPEDTFVLPPYNIKTPTGLRPWQVEAASKLCSAINYWGAAIDGSDCGVGKTYSACAVARELDLNICVVCPKSVIKAWRKVITEHFKLGSKLIGIVNYEKLRNGRKDSPIASYILHKHKKRPDFEWKLPKKTLIIWDESQKLKNWKTKNSKTCQAAIKAGYPMLFCSATNATNPLEMRTVGLALKLFTGSNSYYTWATDNGVYKGNWGLEFNDDPKILKRLHTQLFDKRGVRLRRDEIPGFPVCEVIPEVYNMEEEDVLKINETYADMERELAKLSTVEKKDSIMEAVIQLRMRQRIELIKVPLFVDMIEEAKEEGFSVAVFVNFTDTINALATRLNTKCIFDGKTSDVARDENVERFQEDKERVILVNIQSGGAGLSLHDLNGKYPRMSIISPTFSPIFMRQALGRIWRDDAKTKSIQRIVCVANTVEEDVCHNVQQKLNNLDLLNDGDLSYGKNYEIISD